MRARTSTDNGLGRLHGQTPILARLVLYNRSHVIVLNDARRSMERLGFTTDDVITHLAGGASPPWTHKQLDWVKKSFQREIRSRIQNRFRPDAEMRMRKKLERWRFGGNPRILATRALRKRADLKDLVPPRVVAAVFSAMWNRWPTARRFQERSSPDNRCVLGCPGKAEDSLEHYARCRVLLDVASRQLNLRFKDDDALPFWMLVADDRLMHKAAEMLTRIAVLVYAAYWTTMP